MCAGRCGLGTSKWSSGKPPVGLLFFVRGFWAQDGGMTGTLRERLIALIEPVVADLGCELVDID